MRVAVVACGLLYWVSAATAQISIGPQLGMANRYLRIENQVSYAENGTGPGPEIGLRVEYAVSSRTSLFVVPDLRRGSSSVDLSWNSGGVDNRLYTQISTWYLCLGAGARIALRRLDAGPFVTAVATAGTRLHGEARTTRFQPTFEPPVVRAFDSGPDAAVGVGLGWALDSGRRSSALIQVRYDHGLVDISSEGAGGIRTRTLALSLALLWR